MASFQQDGSHCNISSTECLFHSIDNIVIIETSYPPHCYSIGILITIHYRCNISRAARTKIHSRMFWTREDTCDDGAELMTGLRKLGRSLAGDPGQGSESQKY